MKPLKVIEKKRNGAKAILDRVFEQAEAKGMPIQHDSQTYHLQCRPIDRTNWLGVRELASALPNDTDTMVIMTYENVPITLTKVQVIQAMLNIGRYSQALYGARWNTRNAINQDSNTNVEQTFTQTLQAILS